MERSLTRVLVERERLRARTAQQRIAIAHAYAGLRGPAAVVDSAMEWGRFLRRHPVAVAGLVASVVVLRARTVLGAVSRGIGMWRLLRRVRTTMHLLGL